MQAHVSYGIDHMVTGTTMQGPGQYLETSACLKAGKVHFVLYVKAGDEQHESSC